MKRGNQPKPSPRNPGGLTLVRQALTYRKTNGAIVKAQPAAHLSIKLGEPIWAKIDGRTLTTDQPVDLTALEEFERRGVSFARLLIPADQAAS